MSLCLRANFLVYTNCHITVILSSSPSLSSIKINHPRSLLLLRLSGGGSLVDGEPATPSRKPQPTIADAGVVEPHHGEDEEKHVVGDLLTLDHDDDFGTETHILPDSKNTFDPFSAPPPSENTNINNDDGNQHDNVGGSGHILNAQNQRGER